MSNVYLKNKGFPGGTVVKNPPFYRIACEKQAMGQIGPVRSSLPLLAIE